MENLFQVKEISELINKKPVSVNEKLLTPRKKGIIRLICDKRSTQEISEILHISTHTIYNHRKSILAKTNQDTTAGLVKWAIENEID